MKANTMNMRKLVAALGAVLLAGAAVAATDSADLAVSATVQNACAIGTGTMGFGTLALEVNAGAGTVTGTNHDADSGSSISIACTKDATATITAGNGSNADGATRRMKKSDSLDYITYDLYTSSARSTVLNGVNSIAYTGTGAATTSTVIYGRIGSDQLALVPAGSYSDTVAMTITYTP
jgi:spore coat protein U-like protein